jgi:beta-phosphoglucomutase-like phosphatase (HAD superfamily)
VEPEQRTSAPIAAVIFDMDGLLVDSETVSGEALRRFLQGHGHEMLPSTIDGALGRRLPEAVAVVAKAYGLPGLVEDLVGAFDAMRLHALRGNVVAMRGAAAFGLGRGQGAAACTRYVELSRAG